MSFTKPIWISNDNTYQINITARNSFEYNEVYDLNSKNPDIESSKFKKILEKVSEAIYTEGKDWFASPIKTNVFLKKVNNTFMPIPNVNTYGNIFIIRWIPITLYIKPNNFELIWKPSVENNVEFTEELTEPTPTKTIVIQSNPAEEIELSEIQFDSSEQEIQITSRSIMKRKIREARLKAAFATMKAERMAEKYFRRYGIHAKLEYESDLSFDTDEEESENESED